MKILIIAILLIIGQVNTNAEKQPKLVVKALKQKFPSALNIKWDKEYNYYWKASFTIKDRKVSASFDPDGHWLGSQMEITFAELHSEEVRSAIKRDFPTCEILSILINDTLLAGTIYDVKVQCGDNISEQSYDSNGYGWPPKM